MINTSAANNLTGSRVWIAGDCWLNHEGPRLEVQKIWGDPVPAAFIVNLECSVPVGPARAGRRALLPLDSGRLPELSLAGKTVCVLANNHVSDYGSEGLLATLESVRCAGMQPLGAGATLEEARRPVIIETDGHRVGLLAYADTRFHVGAVAATDHGAGVAPLNPEIIISDLKVLAGRVDAVWLFLHWGREHLRFPELDQRRMAFEFSKAGATLVVGVHPHVLRGWERVSNTVIYYSLGNFIFPPIPLSDGTVLHWHRENRQGLVLKGVLTGREWSWEHVPYVVTTEGYPSVPEQGEQQAILRRVAALSDVLNEEYTSRYPGLQRQELVFKTIRRLSMMTWTERLRLPARILSKAINRSETRHGD